MHTNLHDNLLSILFKMFNSCKIALRDKLLRDTFIKGQDLGTVQSIEYIDIYIIFDDIFIYEQQL